MTAPANVDRWPWSIASCRGSIRTGRAPAQALLAIYPKLVMNA
jgi:hypothetical protein